MKELNPKLTVVHATHSVKVRLQATAKANWDSVKLNLEMSAGKTYSDSAFFNWAINELASYILHDSKRGL